MKRIIRLNERDLTRLVKRAIRESKEDDFEENDFDVPTSDDVTSNFLNDSHDETLDFAFDMLGKYAPDGPRNRKAYRDVINKLERDMGKSLRYLRQNIGDRFGA